MNCGHVSADLHICFFVSSPLLFPDQCSRMLLFTSSQHCFCGSVHNIQPDLQHACIRLYVLPSAMASILRYTQERPTLWSPPFLSRLPLGLIAQIGQYLMPSAATSFTLCCQSIWLALRNQHLDTEGQTRLIQEEYSVMGILRFPGAILRYFLHYIRQQIKTPT